MTEQFSGFGSPQQPNQPYSGQGFGQPHSPNSGFGTPHPGGGGFGQPQPGVGGFVGPEPQGQSNGENQHRAEQDYRFVDSSSSISKQSRTPSFAERMRARVSYKAPLTLWLAAVLQLGTVAWVVYRLSTMHEGERPRNFSEHVVVWAIILIVLVVLAGFVLKGEPAARIALTVLCIVGVLLLAWGGYAPVGLFSLITIVLIWLPVTKQWFTHEY